MTALCSVLAALSMTTGGPAWRCCCSRSLSRTLQPGSRTLSGRFWVRILNETCQPHFIRSVMCGPYTKRFLLSLSAGLYQIRGGAKHCGPQPDLVRSVFGSGTAFRHPDFIRLGRKCFLAPLRVTLSEFALQFFNHFLCSKWLGNAHLIAQDLDSYVTEFFCICYICPIPLRRERWDMVSHLSFPCPTHPMDMLLSEVQNCIISTY